MAFRARSDVDTAQQQRAIDEALGALGDLLANLSREAKDASRVASRGKAVDLTAIHSLMAQVRTAEEQCDLAALDLQTALGEDA